VITEPGKMGHPHGLDEPAFRIDFTNPTASFPEWASVETNQPKWRRPSLRLHFHPIAGKPLILKTIEREQMYSWDIPTSYAETRDFIVVTSPAWINEGDYSDDARKLMKPLERALKECFWLKKFGPNATVGRWSLPDNSLAGRLIVAKSRITLSEFFDISLELKNVGASPVTVMTDCPLVLKVQLKDAAGRPVETKLERLDVISARRWAVLAPGEATGFKVSIKGQDVRGAHLDVLRKIWTLPPGKYSFSVEYSSKEFFSFDRPQNPWKGDVSVPPIDLEILDQAAKVDAKSR
jgi:hypothetical protein